MSYTAGEEMRSQKSSIVGVKATNSVEYVSTVFELLDQGHTVVNIKNEADAESLSGFEMTSLVKPDSSTGWYQGPAYRPNQSQDIAQILFTSGTEGKPKGIGISHGALANTAQRLIDVMGMDDSIREYVGVPVHFSFGFGRCRAVSQAGGRFFIPSNGFNPMEIADLLSSGDINAISAVPTLWRMILQGPDVLEGLGETVRWIEIGSQYMSRAEKEMLRRIFPNAVIVQHYGLTEASRTTFLKIHEIEGVALESVGECVGDCEVNISEDGKIKIRGPHVASCVYKEGVKAAPLIDGEGWFCTNDLGLIANGCLYYEGRADDLINCGGVKLSPELVEQKLYEHLERKDGLAITGAEDPLRGQCVLACFLSSTGLTQGEFQRAVEDVLKQYGITASGATKIWQCDSFPTTATGKLKRKQLATDYNALFKAGAVDTPLAADDGGPIREKLVDLWKQALNLNSVPTDVSFYDIGGDSLSSITVALKMEKLGIARATARQLFAGRTIDEIAANYEASAGSGERSKHSFFASISQGVNVTRGLLVLMVIAAHWMPGLLERLPEAVSDLNVYLATLYSFGTPGFAIIFGVGVGLFYYARFLQSPKSLNRLVLRNSLILFVGMVLLSAVRLLETYLEGEAINSVRVANSFYSVISYYLLAVLSVPLWLKFAEAFKTNGMFALALACAGLYAAHILVGLLDIRPSSNGLLQYLNLQLTAKYNYFEMSAGVFAGLILGRFIRLFEGGIDRLVQLLLKACLVLVFFAVILAFEMGHLDLWLQWPKPLYVWSWVLYLGLVCGLLAATLRLADSEGSGTLKVLMNIVACVGLLAFPMFIGHELVLPLKSVLGLLGVPFALLISVGLFMLLAGLAIRHLYRIYYAA